MQVITFNSEPSRVQVLDKYNICSVILQEVNLSTPADRNLASECVGQYLLSRPQYFSNLLPVIFYQSCSDLQTLSKSSSWHVRATFLGAIRFTMSDSTETSSSL